MFFNYFYLQKRWLVPLLLLLVVTLNGRAQAPAWQAAVAITTSSTGSAYANATATDAAGNVYVAGQFSGTVNLGSFSFTSSVGNNGFVAKWSPATRSFSWAKQLGGAVSGVAVVGGSVYAVGYFLGAAVFGNATLTSVGDYDMFVAKLVDAGGSSTIAWAKQAGGAGSDQARAVAATSTGVYVAGTFAQTAAFGTNTLTTGGSSNGFVTKVTDSGSTGVFTWTQQVASSGITGVAGLAAVGSAVYLVGRIEQAATFGNITLATNGSLPAYVAKLLDAGATSSFGWVQAPVSTTSSMYAGSVAVVGSNVYLSGDFTGTATFGTQALTSAGQRDAFVAKLTDVGGMGNFVWAQRAGGPSDDLGSRVAVAGSNVYVASVFTGTASFGSTSLTSFGGGDVYVTCLTDAGSSAIFTWTQQAGGAGNDSSYGLALSGTMPVVVGSFNATANFGNQAITSTGLYSENAFLALLGPNVLATAYTVPLPSLVPYPNPAHGTTTVRVPAGSPATLILLDALGRMVRTAAVPVGSDYMLDLSGLMPGVYALRVQAGEGQAMRQLVVE
ncbi:T9SS type A sorting domain-containing protein [Hymenobacter sp. H14-R3]|uniref:T9SS type A sorting domain-containing protein n=1 Tax=Hymenobacter sp. H14-R3 TaxID=3046308 RepID=UPI0024BA7CBE|nr:T9SS type A sorting domain-containing protein [Hymenobacter sp. H14-R3]MDJ0366447.1 T9SS type A sorting domain-containing protein [Hymenobacter sp. H14-R3]